MRAAGVETIVNSDELAIMGIVEVGVVLPKVHQRFSKTKSRSSSKIAGCGGV